MTKEEARNVFGGSIVNNLLSLGAEPTNVVRQDGLIEWKSDGYIEVELSYANCMAGDKPVDHIRVSNENRGWCGSYTIYGREID